MICEKCMKLKMIEDNGEIFYCGLYVESKNAGLPVYSCAYFEVKENE